MQSRRPFSIALRRLLFLSMLPAGFAACDRHPAGEPPEGYGHGSSREQSYRNHGIDSSGERHFSDTAGADEKSHAGSPATGKAAPGGAGKRLNPGAH